MPEDRKNEPPPPKRRGTSRWRRGQSRENRAEAEVAGEDKKGGLNKAIRIFLKLTLTMLAFEIGIIASLRTLHIESGWTHFTDSILLLVVTIMLIYLFVVKPIRDCLEQTEVSREALRRSEEKYRLLVESAGQAIFTVNKGGTFTFMNRSAASQMGGKADDFIGKTMWELFPKRIADRQISNIRRVIGTGKQTVSEEESVIGGQLRWYETRIQPVQGGDDAIDSALCIATEISDRVKAEKMLRESETRFRTLFTRAPDTIYLVDPEGTIVDINEAGARLTGYSKEELIGESFVKLGVIHPEQTKRALESIRTTTYGEDPDNPREYTVVTKEGSCVPVEVRTYPVIIGGREFALGIARDISERKEAEQALKESEEQFRTLVSNIPGAVYRAFYDGKWKSKFLSAGVKDVTGYDTWEFVDSSRSPVETMHPEDRDEVVKSATRCLERKEPYALEYRIIHANGESRWVWDRGRGVYGEDGGLVYIDGVILDITEHKRAEELFEREARHNELIIRTFVDGFCKIGMDGRLLQVNPALVDMTGYSMEELLQMSVQELEVSQSQGEMAAQKEKLMRTGHDRSEHRIRRKDGRYVDVEIGAQFCDIDGEKLFFSFVRDITELKRVQERLEEYRVKTAQAERLASLGTLSAMLAHELTQPLTVAGLSIENSLEGVKTTCPKEVCDGLRESLRQLSNAAGIVDRFRSFARRSSAGSVRRLKIGEVAERIVGLLGKVAAKSRMSIELNDFEKLPRVMCKQNDLEQLFFVLIQNSMQAASGRKGGLLTVTGSVKDGQVVLEFCDNCGGIAPEHVEKVFEPFFTTKSPGEGTGLGLCIAEQIVSKYGGKIRLDNRFGRGAAFSVSLPLERYSE